MPSPIAAWGDPNAADFMAIKPTQKMQAQTEAMMESARLAERLAAQPPAPPQNGRGQLVDAFA
jgi:hypothetical protein